MNAKTRRSILAGTEYDQYFTPSPVKMKVMDKWATTENTVALCLSVIAQSPDSVKKLAETFRRPTLRATCEAIWQWVYTHINYEKDEVGHEQIRYPSRSWHDRVRGVDCDDYAVFIGSCLTALGIPFQLRVTAYQGGWQHIYPVVPINGDRGAKLDQARRGEYIVVDDVTDAFDYEVTYSKKFDTPMQLEALSGLPTNRPRSTPRPKGKHYVDGLGNVYVPVPVGGLAGLDPNRQYYVDGFGSWFSDAVSAVGRAVNFVGEKISVAAKPIVQAANWVADGVKTVVTTPIRLGILAYMKLNWDDKAGQLRWGYLQYSPFVAKYIGPERHKAIVSSLGAMRAKFTGMGGDANTLRMAILTGDGNADRLVPSTSDDLQGLGMLLANDPDWLALQLIDNINSPIPANVVFEGNSAAQLNGLGALPAVAAAVAAALPIIKAVLSGLDAFLDKNEPDPVPAEYQTQDPGVTDEQYINDPSLMQFGPGDQIPVVSNAGQPGTLLKVNPPGSVSTGNTGIVPQSTIDRIAAGMTLNITTAVDASTGSKLTVDKFIDLVSKGAQIVQTVSGVIKVVRQDVKQGNTGVQVVDQGTVYDAIPTGQTLPGQYLPAAPAPDSGNNNALLIGGGIALAALLIMNSTRAAAPAAAPAPAPLSGVKRGKNQLKKKKYKVVDLT